MHKKLAFFGSFSVIRILSAVSLLFLCENTFAVTINPGQYIVSEPLPSWVDTNADAPGDESSIQYHGYNNNQASESIPENSFYTIFDYGKIYGDSACLTYGAWGDVSDEDFNRGNVDGGNICWCRLNGENDPNNNYYYKSKWVARGVIDNNQPCWENCAHDCAQLAGHVYRWPDNSIKENLFNTTILRTADCPAGSYCPGGDIESGTNGQFACPENSHSESGASSCVCDTKYETANGAGATIENPCIKKTGPDSCDAETEYWDTTNQTCVARNYSCSFILQPGQYIPPVYDISGTGYKCHKSRSVTFCDDDSLIANKPENSWLVHFGSDPQINFSGRSACSDIGGSYKELSDVEFDSDTIYGSNCWCNMTDIFGSTKWILSGTFENGDICGNECAGNCGDHFSWDNDFKTTLMSTITTPEPTNCPANSFCRGGEYSCLDTTTSIEKCPTEYPNSDEGATDKTKCYATLTFVTNGGSAVAVQKKYYSDANATGYTLDTTPTTTRQNSDFIGWYDNAGFSGEPITTTTQFLGNKTLYAKWKTNIYTIKYIDENGQALTTTNPTTWTAGSDETIELTPATVPEGWLFYGWHTNNVFIQGQAGNKITTLSNETIVSLAGNNSIINIYGHKYPEPKFFMTTTPMNNGEQFAFTICVNGEIYVDWDDGIVEKTNASGCIQPTHKFNENKAYTIKLSSNITNNHPYSNSMTTNQDGSFTAHNDTFYITDCWTQGAQGTTPKKLAGISGKLSDIFPTAQDGSNPSFTNAFCGCENLTGTIPDGFFDKITGQPSAGMFYGVFRKTAISGQLPDGLFGGLDGTYTTYLFGSTFSECKNLTGPIPENLFGNIHGAPAPYMFSQTFNNCTNLTGPIPEHLFGNINGAPATSMFSSTFWNASNINGPIPENLFGNLHGAPAGHMFTNTFDGTSVSGPIPQNLFRNISGPAQPWMYNRTFALCSGLTGNITEGFFGNITEGPIQEYTYNRTFMGASGLTGPIPENLFGNVTGTALRAFYETFKDATNIGKDDITGEATPIPVGLFKSISGPANATNMMFSGMFQNTQYLTAPVPTELFKGITGYLSDNAAGNRASTYTAGGMANIFNNSNISTVCDAGQYQYLTGFEADWDGHVACEMCPTEYPDSISGDNVTMKKCFTECPEDPNGGEYVSGHKYWTEDEEHIGDISSCVYKYTINYVLNGGSNYSGAPAFYNSGSETIINGTPTRNNSNFLGWCVDEGLSECYDSITISATDFGAKTLYAKWQTNIYTIKYVDEDGNNLTTTNPTQWVVGETEPFDLTDPEIPEDWLFNGWYTDNLIYETNGFGNKITHIDEETVSVLAGDGTTITIYGYRYPKPVFWMTTTPMNADEKFAFITRIIGDVYVDWDDGYISKYHGINVSAAWNFTHNYKSSGVYRIGLSSNNITNYPASNQTVVNANDCSFINGGATFYISTNSTFCWEKEQGTTPLKISGIDGKLSDVFPTLDDGTNPSFLNTFCGCTNLTGSIPNGFFDKIHGQPVTAMFLNTFFETGLSGPIPDNLFGGLEGTYTDGLFSGTFSNSSFHGTIPTDSIDSNTGEIHSGLFGKLSGAPKICMFANTFDGATLTGQIPEHLFGSISGDVQAWMFNRTFALLPNLTGPIPNGLFGNITGQIQKNAFNRTFWGDTNLTGPIPENLFGSVSGVATHGFREIFKGATNLGKDENGNATPIPVNLFQNISGDITGTEMFSGTFADTQHLTAPVPTELFKGITGYLSNNAAGNRASTYTAGGMANIFNNSNISTVCDAGKYQYLTGFEADWDGHVACEMCPTEYPDSISGDNVTMKKCFTECPEDPNGGEYVSGHKYWTEDEEHIGDISSCVYKYNITYVLNGADESLNTSNPTEYLSNMDSDLTISAPDEREFFGFIGWYDNAEFTGDAITTIPVGSVGNKTLYAKWDADAFNITYELDGGENYENAPATYTADSETIIFGTPTRHGYNFVHWLDENGDVITEIPHGSNGHKTLTAVWEIAEYQIIYDYTNGGSGCDNEYYTVGVEKEINCVPTNTGYIFNGWFDGNDNQVFVIPSDSVEDITLYAQWTPETYYIEYVLNGGTNFANAQHAYNYGSETIIDGTPTKKNFLFLGWCSDEGLTDCYDSYIIPNTATGKQTLYAKWIFYCESQKWMHIGENPDDKICLTDEKPNGPSMAIQTNDGVHYIILTNDDININKISDKKMHVQYNNKTYNAHDNSIE